MTEFGKKKLNGLIYEFSSDSSLKSKQINKKEKKKNISIDPFTIQSIKKKIDTGNG